MKKKLIKQAKNNLGKSVATTQLGFGEKKLSDKLKKEIKK